MKCQYLSFKLYMYVLTIYTYINILNEMIFMYDFFYQHQRLESQYHLDDNSIFVLIYIFGLNENIHFLIKSFMDRMGKVYFFQKIFFIILTWSAKTLSQSF